VKKAKSSQPDWVELNRLKAQAARWQEKLNKDCAEHLNATGSLADEALCRESTEWEQFVLRIADLEKRLANSQADEDV
jgi:hypothetical protein